MKNSFSGTGRSRGTPALATGLLTLLLLVTPSCQIEGTSSGGSVCPTCEPQVGGETGDFGGSLTFCGGVSRRAAIDRATAQALGFDIAEIERRIARPIDASLLWVASADEGGGAPSGFERDTRVRAEILITGYGFHRPDPEFCDGNVCSMNGGSVPQAMCEGDRFLDLAVSVNFETADGAVRGTAVGQAVQWVPDPRGARDPSLPVVVNTFADLHDVTGRLHLDPARGHARYRGHLSFSAELSAAGLTGTLLPSVLYDTPDRTVWHTPLVGDFPASGAPTNGQAEADAGRKRDESDMPTVDAGAKR